MGTPEFAVAHLAILVENDYDVVGVITAPDRKAGRGQKLRKSAVKEYAETKGLKVLQPTNLKNEAFLEELAALQADVQVVVAFRMLPEVVWAMPPKGTFNLHASLLPQYRGAAPINWAIINGEKTTGATTFFIDKKIDTGDLLFQESIDILPEETAGELHDRLMHLGAKLALKTIQAIENDDVQAIPQNHAESTKHAPKIFKEDCLIDWNADVISIFNKIRGLSPYPVAFTHLKDKTLKIYKAEFEQQSHAKEIGSFETDGKTFLRFYAKDGFINVLKLQLEGKKRMDIDDFLRGYKFE